MRHDAVRDDLIRDDVMRDYVMRNDVVRDDVLRDDVMRDDVLRDDEMCDDVMRDDVMRDVFQDLKDESLHLQWTHAYTRMQHKKSHTLTAAESLETAIKTIGELGEQAEYNHTIGTLHFLEQNLLGHFVLVTQYP